MLYLRSIHLMIYGIFSLIYVKVKFYRHVKFYGSLTKDLKSFELFITLLLSLQIIMASYSHGFTSMILSKHYFLFWVDPSHVIFTKLSYFKMLGMGFFLQNFFLFLFPSLLTNKKLNLRILSDKTINQAFKRHETDDLIFRNNSEQMKRILSDYLVKSPFLNHHFSLKRMSFELNISERDISNYFKSTLNTNFVEWKNKLRLDHAIQLIDSGHSSFLTIQGIAHSVGIESRSKFIDLFKKNKGLTPSGYIKNRKI